MHFDLIDIRLFANIAETKSLSRGAELSHMCPSAASKRIRNVEESIGASLLYRTSAGVSLTRAGQAFHDHSRVLLHELEELERDLEHYSASPKSKGFRGTIRVSAGSAVVSEFLPAILSKYSAIYPNVNVEVRAQLTPEILHAVNAGLADVGIYLGDVPVGEVHALLCGRYPLVLITSSSHVLAHRKTAGISFGETLNFDYVTLPENSTNHAFLKHAAEVARKTLKVRFHLPTFEDLGHMVQADLGIAVVPEFVARRLIKTKGVRVMNLSDEWAVCDMWICMRKDSNSQMIKDFSQLLIAGGTDLQLERASHAGALA
jgi:DNA-binding transcriptional LysR family regulator